MRTQLSIIIVISLLLSACGSGETMPEQRKISADEAYQIMTNSDDHVLLDVRTEEEYNQIRINGAILIPDYDLLDKVEAELPDKDALILVYCRSGRRSASAVNQLVELGYSNVYDFGGIIDWPYETAE